MIAPFLLASLAALYLVLRRPVLRRLAVRNATRRPRETMLVVLGSLLGTAIITASFVVGDTLDASLRNGAVTQLGPVDVAVRSADLESGRRVFEKLRGLPADSAAIDGVDQIVVADAAVSAGGDKPRAEPKALLLEVDFARTAKFGGDPEATGIFGDTPQPGRAVIVDDLARTLSVKAGDTVFAYVYGQKLSFEIDRVIGQRGVAGFPPRFDSDSANLLIPPGTLGSAFAAAPAGSVPPGAATLISGEGGTFAGVDQTDAIVAEVTRAFGGERPAGIALLKRDVLDTAAEVGQQFTELFGGIGFFSVLAGILLLVLIFVMLAEERKSEMGMLRAMGLRRSGLVGSYYLEGWLYALASSAAGAVVGVGLGYVVSRVAGRIFSTEGLTLTFSFEPASLVTGFMTGFAISILTVLFTALSISRVNVIRAIRDLPEPVLERPRRRSRILGGLLVALGLAWAVSGISGEQAFPTLAGVPMVMLGAAMSLRGTLPRRLVVSLAGAIAIAWSVLAFTLFPETFRNAEIPLFVVHGVILTASAVAIVSQNQDVIGRALRRLGGGSLALRLGLANPLAKRFRTGLILASYSLVVFTLTFITVFSNLFAGQVAQFTRTVSGGFDLVVSSNQQNPVRAGDLTALPDVETVAPFIEVDAEFKTSRSPDFQRWYVLGISRPYVDVGGVELQKRGSYPTDKAAYEAVLADPTKAIVSEFFLQNGGGPPEQPMKPGDKLTIRDPVTGNQRELTVAALSEGAFANDGVFISSDSVRSLYGPRAVESRYTVATKPGVDPQDLAQRINGQFLANGADAESYEHLVNKNLNTQLQFFRLMQGYLAIGLVVGIAGLGVQMIRAVRERRRQVGVLRALGFQAPAVRRAFLSEAAFIAFEGITIGVVLAIMTAWQIVANDTFGDGLGFSVPYGQLAVLVVGTFVASLIATATPAQQASRIRPAVALRIAD